MSLALLLNKPFVFNAARAGVAHLYTLHKIGNREIVGYGLGPSVYVDSLNVPMPAIRFQEDSPKVQVRKSDGLISRVLFNVFHVI